MLVLAIDTSTKVGSVALYSTEKGVLGEISLSNNSNHSEYIMSTIDFLLKACKLNIADVDRVAVGIGPGSFTGVRIGVGLAKGLAYSSEKEIVGINELEAIASLGGELADKGYKIIPLIDARKERVFYSIYSQSQEGAVLVQECNPIDGEIREIVENHKYDKVLFLGDGAIKYREIIEEGMEFKPLFFMESLNFPRASLIAELGAKREPGNLVTLEPIYVQKTQAEREREEKINKETK